jgi:hypothetical protein
MLVAWALALVIAGPHRTPLPGRSLWRHVRDPRVSIWTDRETPYRRGDAVRVYASPSVDGYLTVFRIDTDGGLRVLFPREPWADTWTRGGRVVQLDDAPRGSAFLVDDYPGIGYLFAITSPEPFDYSSIVRRDQWDYREIANGRLHSDPYAALTQLADRLAPSGGYDYDVTPYYVERRYDFPRFVCYDCHSYSPYSNWNPYGSTCKRYRVVVYDDPIYYPYQAYGSRVVVPGRPARLAPRYVFHDADGRSPWVSRVRRAPGGSAESGPVYRDRRVERDPLPTPVRRPPAQGRAVSAPTQTTGEPDLRRRKPDDKPQDPTR